MGLITFEKYELVVFKKLNDATDFRLNLILGNGKSLQRERRKIYIIKDLTEFLYVGEANTSIKTRFKSGFISHRYFVRNEKARGGYKGYKWIGEYVKKEDHVLNVFVSIFDQEYDIDRTFLESVEGEIVFLIRQNSGSWPLFQNEIHFNNRQNANAIALEIFNKILSS